MYVIACNFEEGMISPFDRRSNKIRDGKCAPVGRVLFIIFFLLFIFGIKKEKKRKKEKKNSQKKRKNINEPKKDAGGGKDQKRIHTEGDIFLYGFSRGVAN